MPMLIAGDGDDMINYPLCHSSAVPRLADTGSMAHATVRVPAEYRRGELAMPRFQATQPESLYHAELEEQHLTRGGVYHLLRDTSPDQFRWAYGGAEPRL